MLQQANLHRKMDIELRENLFSSVSVNKILFNKYIPIK